MENDCKAQLYKLLGITLFSLLGILIAWEFWLENLVIRAFFQETISKTIFEKWVFVITCFFFAVLALIPLLQKVFNALFDLKWAEKALKHNKAKELRLNEIDNSLILTLDKKWKVSQINPKGCEILGCEKDEIIGKDWFETYIPENSREQVKTSFQTQSQEKSPSIKQFKTPLLIKGKEKKVVALQTTQLFDEKGIFHALLISGLDITDQFLLGKRLRGLTSSFNKQIDDLKANLQTTHKNMEKEKELTRKSQSKVKLWASLGNIFSDLTTFPIPEEEDINSNITLALKYFAEYSASDTGYIALFVDENSNIVTTHIWGSNLEDDISLSEEKTPLDSFPWFKEKILNREIIHYQDIDEMPPEANSEKETFLSQGIKSTINIPLIFAGNPKGYLCFESKTKTLWDQGDTEILLMLGELISNIIPHPEIKSEPHEEITQITEEQIKNLKESLEKKAQKEKAALQKRFHDLEVEIETKREITREIEDSRLTMENQWKSANKELEELKKQIDLESTTKNQLEENLQKTQNVLSEKDKEIKTIEDNYSILQMEADQLNQTIKQLQESRASMDNQKQELDTLEAENLKLQSEIKQFEQTKIELEETRKLMENKKEEYKALESVYSKLKGEIDQLEYVRQELIEAKDSLDILEQEERKRELIQKSMESEIEDTKVILDDLQKKSAALTQMDLPVFQVNKNRAISAWNKYAENLMGQTSDKTIGQPLSIILASKKDENALNQLLKNAMEQGTQHEELVLIKASGEEFHARIFLSPLTDDNSTSVGAIGYIMDLTEIVNKEKSISQDQDRYNAVREKSRLMIVNLTPDFRILDFNPETQAIFGWDRKGIFEKNFFDKVLPEEMRDPVAEDVAENLEQRAASDFEGPYTLQDLTKRIILWSVIREKDNGEKPCNFLAIGQDITELREAERALEHYEGLLHSIVDNGVDGFITIDENGILQSVNSAAERIFGYSSSEIVGQNVNILMPEPYRKEHSNYINDYLLTGKAKLVGKSPREFLGQRKDGTVFPLEIAIREIQQDYRRVFVGIIHDITKRKQIEQTLKESEEKFRRLLVAESDAILIINHSNKRILDANDAAVKLLGYDREELLKIKSSDLATEPEKPSASGNGHSLNQPAKITLQYYKKKDGTVFPAQITTSAFMAKNHKLSFRIIRDTTEQRRLEENLKGSQEHLKTIIDNTPEAVYLKDTEGAFILVNKKFESLFNVSSQEIKGKTAFDIFPKDLAEDFQANENKVLDSGATVESEQAILHDDGVHTYHTIKFPLKHSPSNVTYGVCGILKDITQNTRLKEEISKYKSHLEEMVEARTKDLKLEQEKLLRSEKLAVTGNMANKVSQQINNSIFGIRNILEQIDERVPLEEIHKGMVSLGVKECNRIADFIKKLQLSYDPEPGTIGPVDINSIIEEIVKTTREKSELKELTMEKHLSPDVPKIEGVSEQIKQLIQNIVQNAEESLSKDKGRILIATEREGSNIKIIVQDTGCGIPPENIAAIFDPFFTTKTAIHRSGLGLLLSLGIAKVHKGDIDVASKPGSGTTFTISLPIEGLKGN